MCKYCWLDYAGLVALSIFYLQCSSVDPELFIAQSMMMTTQLLMVRPECLRVICLVSVHLLCITGSWANIWAELACRDII